MQTHPPEIILITGCAGFIGSHLVDHFIQAGQQVIGVDNFCPLYDRRIKENNLAAHSAADNDRFTLIEADVADSASMRQLAKSLQGVTVAAILHMAHASQSARSTKAFEAQFRVNVIATRKLLGLAQKIGNPHFIFFSTTAIYQTSTPGNQPFSEDTVPTDPSDSFALTKLMGEQIGQIYAAQFDARFTALRVASVYGPRLRPDTPFYNYLEQVANVASLPENKNDQVASYPTNFIYIDDLVQATAQVIDRVREPFEIINLASTERTCPQRFFEAMSHIFGVRDGHLCTHPAATALFDNQPPLDLTKARQLLGFEARTDFKTGARKLAEWFFEHHRQA